MNVKKTAPLVVPSLVVLVLWIGLVWVPARGDRDQSETRIVEVQQERLRLINRLDEVQFLPSLELRMERRIRELKRAVPEVANIGDFLTSIDGAALRADVVVDNLAPTGIADNGSAPINTRMPDGISSISVGLTVSGDYEHLLQFLDSIAAMNRLVIVDTIDVFATIEDPTVLSIIIELRIFTSGPISAFGVLDRGPEGQLALLDSEGETLSLESGAGQ